MLGIGVARSRSFRCLGSARLLQGAPGRTRGRAANIMTDTENKEAKGDRIARVLARAGLCSRRQAEVLIPEDRVKVNGKKLNLPAVNVTPASLYSRICAVVLRPRTFIDCRGYGGPDRRRLASWESRDRHEPIRSVGYPGTAPGRRGHGPGPVRRRCAARGTPCPD